MTTPAEIAEFVRVCRESALTERSRQNWWIYSQDFRFSSFPRRRESSHSLKRMETRLRGYDEFTGLAKVLTVKAAPGYGLNFIIYRATLRLRWLLNVWMNSGVLPDQQLIVTARSDDTTFGILQSRFHAMGGSGSRNRPRLSRPADSQARTRRRVEKTHLDEPLQPVSGVAGERPSRPR